MKKKIFLLVLMLVLVFGIHGNTKNPPTGTNRHSPTILVAPDNVDFLYDLSFKNQDGHMVHKQQIWPAVFNLINEAQDYILIDMFLFNSWAAKSANIYIPLAEELSTKLIAKKNTQPNIKIDFITDPINTVYGGASNKQIENLKKAGINVIITDLKPLRDSNPFYSSWWRTFFSIFGNSIKNGWLKHPFSATDKKVTLRSYLALLNFKANHRKIILANTKEGLSSIITSANPHNGSSAHENIACKINNNELGEQFYRAEQAIARLSASSLQTLTKQQKKSTDNINDQEEKYFLKLLTEKSIKDKLLKNINSSSFGDKIYLAMFYLSDRDIIKALISSAKRGAEIRIILDPNKDAFGYKKNGVPNRPVAEELKEKSDNKIKIRWYNTHGEQFHTKLNFFQNKSNTCSVLLGSANLTRKNLENYNLESDLSINAKCQSKIMKKIKSYYNLIWFNQDNIVYTLNYDKFKNKNKYKKYLYLFQENSGIASF